MDRDPPRPNPPIRRHQRLPAAEAVDRHTWWWCSPRGVFKVRGNLSGYEARIRRTHQRIQARADDDPNDRTAQRDLSVSHEKLGDLASARGDLPTAETHYRTDLGIAERLTAADPSNAQAQRDLSISHNLMAQTTEALGQTDEAAWHRRAAADIEQRLSTDD